MIMDSECSPHQAVCDHADFRFAFNDSNFSDRLLRIYMSSDQPFESPSAALFKRNERVAKERRNLANKHLRIKFEDIISLPFADVEAILASDDLQVVTEAISFKAEVPHKQHTTYIRDKNSVLNRWFVERAYEYRPIKIVEFEQPRPHCVVYLDLKHEVCANLFPSDSVMSEEFRFGGRRSKPAEEFVTRFKSISTCTSGKNFGEKNDKGTVVISRDVKFEEDKEWDWKSSHLDEGEFKVEPPQAMTTQPGNSNERDDRDDAGPSHSEADEEDGIPTDFSSPESRVQKRGQPMSFTPLISNKSDPARAPERTFDNTPIQGFKKLTEVYELLLSEGEPENFKEAVGKKEWNKAMNEEIASIERNKTWTLVDLPNGHRHKGRFKIKKDAKGKITRHKARLVAKGYIQQYGVDYDEVFAPVARLETVRLVLALSAHKGWLVHHLDVKTAFLHGDLSEEVFVKQPEGFEKKGQEEKVYKLTKALYGLKQAPRAWNTKLDGVLKGYGFKRCQLEQAVYTKRTSLDITIIVIYVDDLLVTGSSQQEVSQFKRQMEQTFEMSDLGLLTYYLGLEVSQGLEDCNSTKIPMEPGLKLAKNDEEEEVDAPEYRRTVGCLRYLTHTRPDLMYAVGYVSRYMQSPKAAHHQDTKHILRYIKGTTDMGIHYQREGKGKLVGFSDSSYSVDMDDGKGTTGVVFYFNERPITWLSQKQPTVALSSCEAEYMAATAAACQAIWLKGLIAGITDEKEHAVMIRIDNKSAIALVKNPVFHGRSKHTNTRFHYIRECVEKDQIQVEHISGTRWHMDFEDMIKEMAPTRSNGKIKEKLMTMNKLVGYVMHTLTILLCDNGIWFMLITPSSIQIPNSSRLKPLTSRPFPSDDLNAEGVQLLSASDDVNNRVQLQTISADLNACIIRIKKSNTSGTQIIINLLKLNISGTQIIARENL
ncbi:hypothetical protein E3N88_19474 [Mikania micrantha]|uniref:Reverse transcriptase Ty1/copia-type domain-containing protein n=1 Tax=Mikania micrantha TaxID=192012 RepID=A0A5N6NR23_9ASTR|nr:hypothetical protein E3N88_19474 [Mikania micrantha]